MRSWITLCCCLALIQVKSQTISFTLGNETCGSANGMITAQFSGFVQPLELAWSTGIVSNGDTLITTITGLSAGNYALTITDGNGIVVTQSTDILNVPGLELSWAAGNVVTACDGQCEMLTYPFPSSGVPPFSASTLPASSVTLQSGSITFAGLCGGNTYTATITDSQGCSGSWNIQVDEALSPVLLNETITGSCAEVNNGGALLQFDQSVAYFTVGGAGTVSYPGAGSVQVAGLDEGSYTAYAFGTSGCYDTLYINIPALSSGCGTISGVLFADLNGNCVQDAGEPGIPNRVVTIDPGGIPVLTDDGGYYSRGLTSGAYTLDVSMPGATPNCPGVLPAPFVLDMATPNLLQPIALQFGSADAEVLLVNSSHRPGFNAYYSVTVRNNGPLTMNDLGVQVDYDPILTYLYSDSMSGTNNGSTVTWTIPTLLPFQIWQRSFVVAVPADPAFLGADLSATSLVSGPMPDADPLNDTYTVNGIIIGPYDPNDKLERISSGLPYPTYFLDRDTHVDYTIRFQNTGNGPAEDVYLLDTLDLGMDMGSFQVLASSHDMNVQQLGDRILRFNFPGIQLPDSSTDQIGSQGFVRYRITPGDPQVSDILRNTADIYFDFNPPIRTNTSVVQVDIMASVQEENDPSSATIFPNPVSDVLHVRVGTTDRITATIHGTDGRSFGARRVTGPSFMVNTATLDAGTYLLYLLSDNGSVQRSVFVKQ